MKRISKFNTLVLVLTLLLSFNVMLIIGAYANSPEDFCGGESASYFLGTIFFGSVDESPFWCCDCVGVNRICQMDNCPDKMVRNNKVYSNCRSYQIGLCDQPGGENQDAACSCYYHEEEEIIVYMSSCDTYLPNCAEQKIK